jgi:hypothetical protein
MSTLAAQLGHLAHVAAVLAAVLAELTVFRDLAGAHRVRAFLRFRHTPPTVYLQRTFHDGVGVA